MAVLKDLIVHGASRFINIAQFNSLSADKISAEEGIFNKLIATNLSATEASITDLTATNAKVMGLLDVKGELHTNKWTNSNISNIGGSFYISPTVSTTITSGNTPMSVTITGTAKDRSFQVSGGNFTTDAVKIYENDTTHSVYATGTTPGWPVGSHVMVTGNIRLTSTGVDYPLGTLTGYLTAYLSQGGFTVGGISSPALETIITELGTSNLKSYDISISMFEIGPRGSNTLKPVGIMMTSYGVDKSTYIDIYGGVNTKTTDSATGFTIPNVRIGYLGGLPAYTDSNNNSHQPVGWGIYTDNGYFKGVVVADSGLVGNFTIAEDLHSGTTGIGIDANVYVSPGTEAPEGITIAGSPEELTWAFAAGQNFGVTTTGALYATDASISGLIKATDGLQVFDGTSGQALAEIIADGLDIYGNITPYYRGGAQTADHWGKVAHFGQSVQIGGDDAVHTIINNDAISFLGDDLPFGQIDFGEKINNAVDIFKWNWSNYAVDEDSYNFIITNFNNIPIIEVQFTFRAPATVALVTHGDSVSLEVLKWQDYVEIFSLSSTNVSHTFSASKDGNDLYNFTLDAVSTANESRINWSFTVTDNMYGTYESNKTNFENFQTQITCTYDQINYGPHYNFGLNAQAIGTYAFATGNNTIAKKACQLAIGRYNIPSDDALLVVGNGTGNNNRSNLMEVGDNSIIIGSTNEKHLLINDAGVNLRKGDKTVASFGDDICIGNVNDFHVQVTDQRLSFYDGANEVAYVSDDQLYITKSVVLQQMEVGTPLVNDQFGKWGWKVRQNVNGKNNLQLKWLG